MSKKFRPITKAEAVRKVGSMTKIAQMLGITRGAVSSWANEGPIPIECDLQLRFITAPDLFQTPDMSAEEIVRLLVQRRRKRSD